MKGLHYAILGAPLFFFATSARACIPPAPAPEDKLPMLRSAAQAELRRHYEDSSEIVYGVVTRSAANEHLAAFRILHVYKGRLRKGSLVNVISVSQHEAYGGGCPPSPRMAKPIRRGSYGILAFSGTRPRAVFLPECSVEAMFQNGWIVRQSEPSERSKFISDGECLVYVYRRALKF